MPRDALHITFNASANPDVIRQALREVMDGDASANALAVNWQKGTAVIYSETPMEAYGVLSRMLARDPQGFPFRTARVAPVA